MEHTGRREEVLTTLREADAALTITAIADRLGVHPNTVRFHLDTLVTDGRVEQVAGDQRRPGRPAQLFRAVRGMDPGGPRRYQVLAEILVQGIADDRNASATALNAGRAWARRVTASMHRPPSARESVRRLVGLLADLGFAPQERTVDGEVQVGLRHCPFLELAEERSAVVCPIHLGLMQGALEAWNAPVTVDRLEPFVEPGLCLTHMKKTEKVS